MNAVIFVTSYKTCFFESTSAVMEKNPTRDILSLLNFSGTVVNSNLETRPKGPTRVQVIGGILGYVLDGQPTVIFSVSAREKVNVWICARRTTHHDHVSVFPAEKKYQKSNIEREKVCNFRNFMLT